VTEAALNPVQQRSRTRVSASARLAVCAVTLLVIVATAVGFWWHYGRSPGKPDLEQGLAALQEGDIRAARQCMLQLRETKGRETEATLLRGAMLVKMGYYYPGLEELDKVKEQPKLKQRALTLIGEAWYYLGRHVEAERALRKVLDSDPSAIEAHRWLAASYYDMGAIHGALHHLKRTAELDPTDHRPLRLLGLVHKDYERYEDAIPMYQESLRRKVDQPDWDDVRQELAACQLKLRRHRDALVTLEPCPRSPSVLVTRAECLFALGETDAAKDALQKALGKEPKHLNALVLQGSIFLEEGSYEEAIASFKLAAEDHPKDYMTHFKLAQAYAQAGKPELAASAQKIAEDIREIRKVFADLHKAAWDHPEDMRIRLNLAQLARELGRPDLEEMWLKAAAALRPPTDANFQDN
jgi:tetratricopeptide (TPR) repeat protein